MQRIMCTSSPARVLWVCADQYKSLGQVIVLLSLVPLFSPPLYFIKLMFDVGCGLWNPEADALAALREDIDENADQWKEVLRAPEMRSEFLGGVQDEDGAVVKAFAHHNRESALKTKPKVCMDSSLFSSLLRAHCTLVFLLLFHPSCPFVSSLDRPRWTSWLRRLAFAFAIEVHIYLHGLLRILSSTVYLPSSSCWEPGTTPAFASHGSSVNDDGACSEVRVSASVPASVPASQRQKAGVFSPRCARART